MTYIGATCAITGLGFGTDANFKSLERYESGVKKYSQPQLCQFPLPKQCIEFTPSVDAPFELTRLEKFMVMAIVDVLKQTEQQGKLGGKIGLIISTTKGNIDMLNAERPSDDSPIFIPNMARRIAQAIDIQVKPIVVSNACTSGVAAIVVASRLIRAGMFDNIIVVGGDECTDFTTSGFLAFKSVSPETCRPYDSRRDGVSLGEAAAALLVTNEKRRSTGFALEGGAMTNDANHISGPSRNGDALSFAINEAMAQTELTPEDISFINAHGTATVYNDEMESKAMALSDLSYVPLNSLKAYFGHTLGASGVLETIMCVEQMRHSLLIGTLGFEQLGTPKMLIVSANHKRIDATRCLKTASGFGGTNAALIIARDDVAKPVNQSIATLQQPLATCRISRGELELNGKVLIHDVPQFDTFIRNVYHHRNEPNMKFFKMDNMCKMGYIAASYILENQKFDEREISVVLANRASSLDTDLQHAANLATCRPASPATFVYTLPNIVLGEISIHHKIKGETTFFISEQFDEDFMKQYASILMARQKCRYVLLGWCELLENQYDLKFYLYKK